MHLKILVVAAAAAVGMATLAPAQDAKPADQPKTEPAPAAVAEPAKQPEAAKDEPKALSREEREGGLIVEDLAIGTGIEVKAGAMVIAHYSGTLKDGGTEFDSSYKRGEPATFPLKGLIKGWQDGIPGMKVGGKRRLTIPWALAYGEAGRPPVIPPKADLVFVIEVLDTTQAEDVKVGDGAPFTPGANVSLKYTIRRAGSSDVLVTSGDTAEEIDFRFLLPGLQFGLDGMKVGGKRKVVFPASMGWQQKPLPFAAGTRLECEVELVAAGEVPGAVPINR